MIMINIGRLNGAIFRPYFSFACSGNFSADALGDRIIIFSRFCADIFYGRPPKLHCFFVAIRRFNIQSNFTTELITKQFGKQTETLMEIFCIYGRGFPFYNAINVFMYYVICCIFTVIT